MISIKFFQFTFPRGKPGTGGEFYYKMSIKTRKQVRLKETLVRSAAKTPRYWRPGTPEASASGRGQEMRQTQPLASPLSVQLLWEEGGSLSVTTTHTFHSLILCLPTPVINSSAPCRGRKKFYDNDTKLPTIGLFKQYFDNQTWVILVQLTFTWSVNKT